MHPMLVICGPTATGKTALALELAKKYNGELVSADSRQIYRGMDIGTGKDIPKNDQLRIANCEFLFKDKPFVIPRYTIEDVPLWMYDVVNPDESFSVGQYQDIGMQVIANIVSRGKLPIVVGGTGFYTDALLYPVETAHIPPNITLRRELELLSVEALGKHLEREAPDIWNALNYADKHNPHRLIRKIEIAVWEKTAEMQKKDPIQEKDNMAAYVLGLTAPYEELYRRIDQRVEIRVQEGIILEIQSLLDEGYTWDLPSMNTFGYKEWKTYFDASREARNAGVTAIIQRWKWDEHGYARRQMTWFRKKKYIQWFDITDRSVYQSIEQSVAAWYNTAICPQK